MLTPGLLKCLFFTSLAMAAGSHAAGPAPSGIPGQAADKSTVSSEPSAERADQKAYAAAMRTPRIERAEALEKFLKDFPQSPFREPAQYEFAVNLRDSKAREAALIRFLRDYPESRFRDQASYKLLDLIRDPDARVAAQEKYIADFPNSIMSESVYRSLLDAYLLRVPPDETRISALIDNYLNSIPAGTIPQGRYTLNRRGDACNAVARRLAEHDVMLDRALELSRKAVASADDRTDPRTRSMYLATLGEVLYRKKDLAAAEQALAMAILASGGTPNVEASLYLGKIYEARNDDAGALNAYLHAASFSGNPEITRSLVRLYVKKYGSLAGLHEKLDAILLARPKAFDPGKYERTGSESGRVVLAELFTGADCPPCVAAELAFDGILDRYDRATVAVLEYHLNIPAPDPMTNEDSEQRVYYYSVAGTPGAVVDGIDRHFEERRASTATENFKVLQGMIEPRLREAPGATFSSLSLARGAGKVRVSGEVRWATAAAQKPGKFRLRIALVEQTVHHTGSNGIHFHHMVVRKMLGPADGISLSGKTGKLKFSESVSLEHLETGLKAFLKRNGKEHASQPGDSSYTEEPYKINPDLLRAVVFVQDDATMQVVQAAYIE
jgi:tetratricopeptide (TPR) repeat protein